jgi:hypothetical protein
MNSEAIGDAATNATLPRITAAAPTGMRAERTTAPISWWRRRTIKGGITRTTPLSAPNCADADKIVNKAMASNKTPV